MNYLCILLIILLPFNALSSVTFKWLGISSFLIQDEKTTILFDPAITRVGFLDYLPWRRIESDKSEVDFWLNKCGVKAVTATLVNHAHSDHVIDAPYITEKYGGVLYGSNSVINIGKGYGLGPIQLKKIQQEQEIKIGDFTVTPYLTPHPPHLMNILLMNGHVEKPIQFPAKAWEFRVGDTYSFLIKHSKFSLLFHAVSKVPDTDPTKELKVDILLMTIANRNSSEEIIQKKLIPSGAKKIIPLHFDNFFFKMRRDQQIDHLWGVKTQEFAHSVAKTSNVELIWPRYCEAISLF